MLKFILRTTILIILPISAIAQSNFIEREEITTDFFCRTPHNFCITDLNGDDNQDILVGAYLIPEDSIKLRWYSNSEGTGSFGKAKLITIHNFVDLTAVHAADLDGDNDQDILATDDSKNLAWFENTDSKGLFAAQRNFDFPANHSNCIQAFDVDNDGDRDVIGISYTKEYLVFWYENLDGTGNFSAIKTLFSKTEPTYAEDMTTADLNNDGYTDIIVSITESTTTNIYYLKNTGNGSFSQANFIATAPSAYSICSADLDNDNDMDIVAVSANGLIWYANTNGQASFSPAKRIAQIYYGVVFPEDIDNDEDVDLIFANYLGRVIWLKNNGSGSFSQQTAITPSFKEPGIICTADFDSDGDKDVLVGGGDPNLGNTGSIIWYENLTNPTSIQDNQSQPPHNFKLFQNYPNPFNPSTTIHFTLQRSEHISLKIYNIAGQEVATLFDKVHSAGEHQVQWRAEGLPGGIYFAKLQAGEFSEIKKLILQK